MIQSNLSFIPDRSTLTEEQLIATACEEIAAAVKEYKPLMLVGLMSGGDDSIPACYVASLDVAFAGVLHVNTGIGVEETREHVRKVCRERCWKLWEYKATEHRDCRGKLSPIIYDDLVLKYGFPGPHGHGVMYSKLKERMLDQFERDMGATGRGKVKRKIMYVSGVRVEESARRKRSVNRNLVQRIDTRNIWIAPIRHWTKNDCAKVREYAGIPRNPVSANLGMSGECLCGAFAHKGELANLKFWYPTAAKRIEDLEIKVKAAGFGWGWEDKPPTKPKKSCGTNPEDQMLCVNCNKFGQLR